METPEIEFMQYLLKRFMTMTDIDAEKASLKDLLDRIDEELTPIGGG